MTSDLNDTYFIAREACPTCGSHAVSEIYRCSLDASPIRDLIATHYEAQGTVDWTILEGTDYVLCECSACDLVYQKNVPNDSALDAIYNRFISPAFLARLEDERLTVDNFNRIAGELDVLFRMTSKHPSQITFLDYGFGHGRWARVARAMGAKVFATEIGEEKKAQAASLGVEIIPDAEVDRLRFDIVHTEQVFEHLVEPAREFRRLSAATDGIMKVAVPYSRSIRNLLRAHGMITQSPFVKVLQERKLTRTDEDYVAIQPLEHLNAYAPRTFEKLAAANGMRIVSRVRRASVAVNPTAIGLLAKSAVRIGTMLAKMAIVPNLGYYLFAPARRATERTNA